MATMVSFCFVDVFARQPLTGNPLSLVIDADDLPEPQMRAIAREFNQSETTFSLGLTEADLAPGEPAQVVSTGAAHLMVPARNRAAVDRAAPDPARLAAVLRQAGGEGCYLHSPDPVDAVGAVACTRFFNPTVGIPEDPATGTAAGPQVAMLVASGRLPDHSTAVVEQGTPWDGPAASRSPCPGHASASEAPAWWWPRAR